MLKRIGIKNYRGVSEGAIEGLTQVNVLVGPNGVGKTTFLEALLVNSQPRNAFEFAFYHRGVPENYDRTNLAFDQTVPVEFESDVRRVSFRPDTGLGVSVDIHSGPEFQQHEQYPAICNSPFNPGEASVYAAIGDTCFIGIDRGHGDKLESAISWAERRGHRLEVLALLRSVLPHLVDIRILLDGSRPVLYIEERDGDKTRVWPAHAAGDGIKRLIQMACRIAGQPKAAGASNLVLIEDPEAFQHFRSIKLVATLLWQAAYYGNAQIVVSTHSLDLVRALVAGAKQELRDRITIFALNRDGNIVRAKRFAGSVVQEMSMDKQVREELGFL